MLAFEFLELEGSVMHWARLFAVQEGRLDVFAIDLQKRLLWEGQISKWFVSDQCLPSGQAGAGDAGDGVSGLEILPQPAGSLFFPFRIAMGQQRSGGFIMVIAIIMHPDQHILPWGRAEFGKNRFDHQRRGKDLFKTILQGRTESEADEAAQRHVLRGTIEAFQMGRLDGSLTDLLNIDGMPERRQSVPIINLKHLGRTMANTHQQNPFGPGNGENRSAAL